MAFSMYSLLFLAFSLPAICHLGLKPRQASISKPPGHGSDGYPTLVTKSGNESSKSVLTPVHPLGLIRPEHVDLTSGCRMTIDLRDVLSGVLRNILSNEKPPFDPFPTNLPAANSSGHLLSASTELGNYGIILDEAVTYCIAAGVLDNIQSGSDVSRTSSCSVTTKFWLTPDLNSKYHSASEIIVGDVTDLISGSLLQQHKFSSNSTVLLMASSMILTSNSTKSVTTLVTPSRKSRDFMRDPPPILRQIELDRDFTGRLEIATRRCALTVCQSLQYPGNPDVTGIGAIAVYGSIVGIYMLLVFWVFFAWWKKTPRRIHGSIASFLETTSWFGVAACLATVLFPSVTSVSCYEKIAIQIVSLLFLNSATLSVTLTNLSEGVSSLHELTWKRRFFPPIYNTVVAYLVAILLWGDWISPEVANGSFSRKIDPTKDDAICYLSRSWVDRPFLISVSFQFFVLGLQVLCFVTVWVVHVVKRRAGKRILLLLPQSVFTRVLTRRRNDIIRLLTQLRIGFELFSYIILPSMGLGVDFVSVCLLRSKARSIYGPSVRESEMSYGQFILLGYIIQTIFTLFIFSGLAWWICLRLKQEIPDLIESVGIRIRYSKRPYILSSILGARTKAEGPASDLPQ